MAVVVVRLFRLKRRKRLNSFMQKREDIMRAALAARFVDADIVIINDSVRHHGHGGDDGSGESHFAVTVVSDEFTGMPRIQRHRAVQDVLAPLFAQGLHALQIIVRTKGEGRP